jgi:hypothetical protein
MLTTDFPFLLPRHVEAAMPAKLRDLAADLERIRSSEGPTEAELAKAPLIVGWHCALTPVGLRLIGFVAGHPLLGNTVAMTSQIWAADAKGTWIRTLSRFYKLGVPFRQDAAEPRDRRHPSADFDGGL